MDLIHQTFYRGIVERRNRVLALIREGLEAFARAQEEADGFEWRDGFEGLSLPALRAYLGKIEAFLIDRRELDGFARLYREDLDAMLWTRIVYGSDFSQFMDSAAKQVLQKQLKENPPPIDLNRIVSTIEELVSNAPVLFRRGIVGVFQSLDSEYRSNDAYALGRRIILTGLDGMIGGKFWIQQPFSDRLRDMDRFFHILDHKKPPRHEDRATLDCLIMDNARPGGPPIETPYFRIRVFDNGNMHVYFRRMDLVNEINEMLALHFKDRLPHGRAR